MTFKLNKIRYRLDYQPFVGESQTQQAYVIQFSDDGHDWYDLEDDFSPEVGAVIIAALEAQNYTHFDDLRPKWVDNKDMV